MKIFKRGLTKQPVVSVRPKGQPPVCDNCNDTGDCPEFPMYPCPKCNDPWGR